MSAILIEQFGFQICDSKLFDYLSYVGQSQSLCRTPSWAAQTLRLLLKFKIIRLLEVFEHHIPLLRSISQLGTISPLLSSLKVEDLSNMLNFAPLPLRSDAVQILFLVKYATVKGCRPVKRVQYDDVCDDQLISDSPTLKKSSKPLLVPELENVEYNT